MHLKGKYLVYSLSFRLIKLSKLNNQKLSQLIYKILKIVIPLTLQSPCKQLMLLFKLKIHHHFLKTTNN